MAQDIKTADIAIIGTGPAGISAAITAKIRNKEILLFGAEPVSSKVAKAHQILNYSGLPAVSGEELAQAYKRHLDELQIAVTKKRSSCRLCNGQLLCHSGRTGAVPGRQRDFSLRHDGG